MIYCLPHSEHEPGPLSIAAVRDGHEKQLLTRALGAHISVASSLDGERLRQENTWLCEQLWELTSLWRVPLMGSGCVRKTPDCVNRFWLPTLHVARQVSSRCLPIVCTQSWPLLGHLADPVPDCGLGFWQLPVIASCLGSYRCRTSAPLHSQCTLVITEFLISDIMLCLSVCMGSSWTAISATWIADVIALFMW